MIRAVLFDLDGLLVDTETLGIQVAIRVCKEIGFDLDKDEQNGFIGVTDEKFYRELFKKRGLKHEINSVLERHFSVYEQLLQTELKAFEAAQSLPKNLKEKGLKLGLVSGSTRHQIDIILQSIGLDSIFDVIISCDDIVASKPDPAGYLLAAQKLEVEPVECLVLEDARTGILAAKSAGMQVVGVENNGGQDLSFADFIAKNLVAIDQNLSGFGL